MRRPSAAREALGLSPLVEAGWADTATIEGVPLIAAGAEPFVFLAGRADAARLLPIRLMGMTELQTIGALELWKRKMAAKTTK